MLRHVCLVCKDIQVNILDKHVCFATLSAVLVVIGQKISLLAIKKSPFYLPVHACRLYLPIASAALA